MKSRETTSVLQMTSMPVLVTLALLLLLVVGSIAIRATRAAEGLTGPGVGSDVVLMQPQQSSAIVDLGTGVA